MKIQDVNRKSLEVSSYWARSKRVVITVNKGQPDEAEIVLDSEAAKTLIRELTEYL